MPEPTEETREKYNSLIERCRSLEGQITHESNELDRLTIPEEERDNPLVKQSRILQRIREKQEKLDRHKKEYEETKLQLQTEFNLSNLAVSQAIKGNRR